jgi:hypothetical protein
VTIENVAHVFVGDGTLLGYSIVFTVWMFGPMVCDVALSGCPSLRDSIFGGGFEEFGWPVRVQS